MVSYFDKNVMRPTKGNTVAIGLFISAIVSVTVMSIIIISTTSRAEVNKEDMRIRAHNLAETALSKALIS